MSCNSENVLEPMLLSIDQVAQLASVSRRLIYRLNDAGHMPKMIKVGGASRFNRIEIEQWINRGCPKDVIRSSPLK